MTHSTRSLCRKDLGHVLFGSSLHLEYGNKDSPMLPCHVPEALARAASIQVSLTTLRRDFLPVTVADWISRWLLSSLALSLICMVTTRSAMTASKPTTVVCSSIGYTNRPGGVRASITGCLAHPTCPVPRVGSALDLPGLYLDLWTVLTGPRGDIGDRGRGQAGEGSRRQHEEVNMSNTCQLSPLDV